MTSSAPDSLAALEEPGPAELEELLEAAHEYVRSSRAANTVRAYQSDWRAFSSWCEHRQRRPLPAEPETICLYLVALARTGAHAVTIQRRLAAISQAHGAAGHLPSPTSDWRVREVMKGIRRRHGVAPRQQKAPLTGGRLRLLVELTPAQSQTGLRDRALLLVGHLGAFRRSELVALDREDVEEVPEGLMLRLQRSKTDQEGEGTWKAIPRRDDPQLCPVRALRTWLEAAEIMAGPIFRPINRHGQVLPRRLSDRSVALIVKRACERAGLDPASFAGHSLRSGFATAAAQGGASERAIMAQTGHRSAQMVRRYIRQATLFEENAARYVEL